MPLSPEVEEIVYPEITPYDEGFLQVSDLHNIYWQAYGNKEGIPVVCLHGGPGSGLSEWNTRLFNPEKFQIILFDQRGCGRSTPFAELEGNTTQHLIADIEKLRELFGHKNWNVFGGSWGSTLALAYTDAHPDHVRALVVYGIFLAREKEYRSMFTASGPAAQLYPEYYEAFLGHLPKSDRDDPISGYLKLFHSDNEKTRNDAIRAWSHWEMRLLALVPDEEMFLPENEDMDFLITHSLFERHYFEHTGFIDGDSLLKNIGRKTEGKQVSIVQGRYDLVCPPETAYELHKAIPHSTLEMAATSGHSGKNLDTAKALMKAVKTLT